MYLFLYNLGIADEQSWGSLILNLHMAIGNFKFGISISSYSNMYIFFGNYNNVKIVKLDGKLLSMFFSYFQFWVKNPFFPSRASTTIKKHNFNINNVCFHKKLFSRETLLSPKKHQKLKTIFCRQRERLELPNFSTPLSHCAL